MPHTIPPFAEIRLPNGCTRFPGNLPRSWAVRVKPINNQLRADVSRHPEQQEQLVCRAFQQCYDVFWEFHEHGGAPYSVSLEAQLGQKVFGVALECKWLPEAARISDPSWRDWVHELTADRFKWTGFENCPQPDPYLFVPFPTERGGAEIPETAPAEETAVAIAKSTGAKRKPGPQTDFENARRVAEIVERVAQGERWTARLDAICEALDEGEKKIPCPKPWRKLTPPISDWSDAAACDRGRARKAIAHHLENARAKNAAS